MSKFKKRNELTAQQVQLKELTQIWVNNGDKMIFNRICDMLVPLITKYFKKCFNDNGAFLEIINDVLINIHNKRDVWKEKQKSPNLQNYSLTVARNMMCNYIKYVNAKKRMFENISDYNQNSITLDIDDYCDEIDNSHNYIEKFCFDNNLYSDPIETEIIDDEKEFAQYDLLQKCIDHLITLQENSDSIIEQQNLNICMEFFNGLDVTDIIKKYDMIDNIKSRQSVQHIFYRNKQKLKKEYQKDYDEMMSYS